MPCHIKIDVDGFEHKVIAGAKDTLQDPRVRSLLVEINTNLEEHRGIIDTLASYGLSHSQEQVDAVMRIDGTFKGVADYVFRR